MTSTLRVNFIGTHSRKADTSTAILNNAIILTFVEATGTTHKVEVAVAMTMMSMASLMAKQTRFPTSNWLVYKPRMAYKKGATLLQSAAESLLTTKRKKPAKACLTRPVACSKSTRTPACRSKKKKRRAASTAKPLR
jgi:hypothetical protein